MKSAALAAIVTVLAVLCGGAHAQSQVMAYTSTPADVYAGPATEYPVVASLPAGVEVAVQGCLEDYTWCDVIAGYDRGWVFAGSISYPYDNTWQPLLSYGPVLGIAVLPFVFADYWPRHYWNRPFFAERRRWWNVPTQVARARPFLPHQGPPGFRHAGRPPGVVAGRPFAGARPMPGAGLPPRTVQPMPPRPLAAARPMPVPRARPQFVPQQRVAPVSRVQPQFVPQQRVAGGQSGAHGGGGGAGGWGGHGHGHR